MVRALRKQKSMTVRHHDGGLCTQDWELSVYFCGSHAHAHASLDESLVNEPDSTGGRWPTLLVCCHIMQCRTVDAVIGSRYVMLGS